MDPVKIAQALQVIRQGEVVKTACTACGVSPATIHALRDELREARSAAIGDRPSDLQRRRIDQMVAAHWAPGRMAQSLCVARIQLEMWARLEGIDLREDARSWPAVERRSSAEILDMHRRNGGSFAEVTESDVAVLRRWFGRRAAG